MDSPAHRYAFAGLIFLMCLVVPGPLWALPEGNIVGVKVSQDAKHIVIRHKGVADRYSAFAIGNPNRLVIDFQETGLVNVPGKIRVGKNSIKEIRLGYSGSRSRVVVDFGGSPVPPYRLHPRAGASCSSSASPCMGSMLLRSGARKRFPFRRKPRSQKRLVRSLPRERSISLNYQYDQRT